MKEIMKINDVSKKMSKMNIIIYGTIRDIENDFNTSFLNLDIISELFNEVLIIIFENDSQDNTRNLLENWHTVQSTKVKKHIILKNDLERLYPLRAHRLAYCRNYILNYIVDNNLHYNYEYAIHCDLDDRFWSVDFESIKTCFQYDSNDWDAMTCVNKNRKYYDFWALRCEKSWFNINIFSCDANNIDYNTKVDSFESLIKNTSGLISTISSFNGLGIYKLKSLINCRYNADYDCRKCNNVNRGCWEDNDHIGVHKQMINNNCKIFINNKMYIQTRPKNSISYMDFINNIKSIKSIDKPLLSYLLINEIIDKKGKWFALGAGDGDNINIISNYYENDLYTFHNSESQTYFYLNKNIKIEKGDICNNIYHNIHTSRDSSNFISFIYIHDIDYSSLLELLSNVYNKISEGCVIVFNKIINFNNYHHHNLKALYEFSQEYEIEFEWLFMNGEFNITGNDYTNQKQMASIKILKNKHFNSLFSYVNFSSKEYEDFNWIFYSNKYSDLNHIKTKEDAYLHWKNYGLLEGRTCKPEKEEYNNNNNNNNNINIEDSSDFDDFDWEMYIELNCDLKEFGVTTKEVAYQHWKEHGIKEGRMNKFDWCAYIKNYNLVSKSIDNKVKAINHWISNGRPQISYASSIDDKELFDWEYYIEHNSDLKHIDNRDMAWYHWCNYGKNEGRTYNSFKWTNYLLANDDLLSVGINTEALAIYHWIHHGKNENRKMG